MVRHLLLRLDAATGPRQKGLSLHIFNENISYGGNSVMSTFEERKRMVGEFRHL